MPWAKPGLPELLCCRFFIYFFLNFSWLNLECFQDKLPAVWISWDRGQVCFPLTPVSVLLSQSGNCIWLTPARFSGAYEILSTDFHSWRQPAQGDGERGTHQLKKTSREFQTWDGYLGFLAGSQGTHLLCACLAQEALKLRCFGPLAEDADVHQTWPGTSAYDTPKLYRDLEFALVRDVLGRCNNMKHQVGWEHFGGLWITFVFLCFPAVFTSSSAVTCFRCACYTGSDWHLLPAPRDSLSFENYWDLSKNLTSHLQLPTQSFLQLLLSTVIKAFTHHILLLHFVTGGVWWITLIILSLQVTQTQHNVSTMVTTEL